MPCTLGIDIGTSKVAVVARDLSTGATLASASFNSAADLDAGPEWSEQDVGAILAVVSQAVKALDPALRREARGVGVTGQMHGVMLWGAAGRKHGLEATHYKYIELFGEPANLDAAEYIYYSLLRQGERLWDVERRRGRQLAKAFKRAAPDRLLGKVGFLHGLFAGYDEQLDQRRRATAGEEAEELMALVKVEEPILEGEFRGHYPGLRFRKVGRGSMAGYEDGFEKGLKLTIHPGLKGKGSGGRGLLPG